MVCSACGRRVDPDRSFCTNCGSSVFVAGNDSILSRTFQLATNESAQIEVQQRQQPRQRAVTTARASSPGCALGGLIRLIVFAGILWYAWTYLRAIPEVQVVRDQIERGESPDFTPVVEALRTRVQRALGEETTPDAPAPAPATPVAPRTAAPEAPAVPGTPATSEQDMYAGALEPGNGVSMPRATKRVRAEYTPEALRARIEGTVVLKCIVNPNGTPSHFSVVRSLDRQLDLEAIKAAGQWRFEPGQRNGEPVPVIVHLEMNFALR